MALYHKYRPASFAEVVGQEQVTQPLMQALDSGHINHAYLFSGPRGTGKTSSARILARSLNCEEGPTSTPCGKCSSCLALAPGGPGNLDVTELDAASHGGVDDARELRDRAFYAPAESRYRLFIIDEAHMVTSAGFNALLKIVEEPPEHLIFIFATTEPEKVLPTIKSRTHHYPFRLLAPTAMQGLLERICEQENVKVDPAVYPLVIRAGGGSPRDALSVLDQLLAGSGADGITYEHALNLLGATDVALLNQSVSALATHNRAEMFSTIAAVVDAGHDPRRFTSDLLDRFRDLILLQAVPDAAETGLVAAPADQLAIMQEEAEQLGVATATRFADVLATGLNDMRGATSPRLLLEIMAARMLLPAAEDTNEALLQRLEQVERGVSANSAAAPSPVGGDDPARRRPSREEAARTTQEGAAAARKLLAERQARAAAEAKAKEEAQAKKAASTTAAAAETAKPAEAKAAAAESEKPAAAPQPEQTEQPAQPEQAEQFKQQSPQASDAAEELDAAAIAAQWVPIRKVVYQQSRTLDVMLSKATVVDYDAQEQRLSIAHASGPLVARINEPSHLALLTQAIAEVTGVTMNVRCLTGAEEAQLKGKGGSSATAGASVTPRSSVDAAPSLPRPCKAPTPAPASTPTPPTPPTPTSDEDLVEEVLADAADPSKRNTDPRSATDIAVQLLQETFDATIIEEK